MHGGMEGMKEVRWWSTQGQTRDQTEGEDATAISEEDEG